MSTNAPTTQGIVDAVDAVTAAVATVDGRHGDGGAGAVDAPTGAGSSSAGDAAANSAPPPALPGGGVSGPSAEATPAAGVTPAAAEAGAMGEAALPTGSAGGAEAGVAPADALAEPMVVCPDSYLFTPSGKYLWTPDRVKAAWESAKLAWRFHLELRPHKAVLLMGVPGSGKSTWLQQNQQPGVVYFDATFDSAWKRRAHIDTARRAGVPVEIVWLDTPLDECIARNKRRPKHRRIPLEVLERMDGLIRAAPPSNEESATVIRVPFQPPQPPDDLEGDDGGGEWTYV